MSSCRTTHYYPPAMFRNDIQLMEKPHSRDQKKTAIYASGAYLLHSDALEDTNNMVTSGMLNIYRSHTTSHFNFSYGALGFMSVYRPDATDMLKRICHIKASA
jgi:hypothetical protein